MIANGEIPPDQLKSLAARLSVLLANLPAGAQELNFESRLLAAGVDLPNARENLLKDCQSETLASADRLRGIEMLLAKGDSAVVQLARQIVLNAQAKLDVRLAVLSALRHADDASLADGFIEAYANFPPELQRRAVELLIERPQWSKALLQAIGRKQLPPTVLNATQVAGLLAGNDAELKKLIEEHWGRVRSERNPQREQIVKDMRKLVRSSKGDALAGAVVFKKTCGQCHKIFGEGAEVGPDLTSNGRNDFEQLLSNVFDPSLVIGRAFQAVNVVTTDGRSLAGLLVEDGADRVVLKLQGGKQEIIRRDEIDTLQQSKLSLMPEGLEKQLKPEEIVNLFKFLKLKKPPAKWPNVE